jgi:hypothetical protein
LRSVVRPVPVPRSDLDDRRIGLDHPPVLRVDDPGVALGDLVVAQDDLTSGIPPEDHHLLVQREHIARGLALEHLQPRHGGSLPALPHGPRSRHRRSPTRIRVPGGSDLFTYCRIPPEDRNALNGVAPPCPCPTSAGPESPTTPGQARPGGTSRGVPPLPRPPTVLSVKGGTISAAGHPRHYQTPETSLYRTRRAILP